MNDGGSKRRKNKAHTQEKNNWTIKDAMSSQAHVPKGVFLLCPLEFHSTEACCTNTPKLGYFDMHHCFSFSFWPTKHKFLSH